MARRAATIGKRQAGGRTALAYVSAFVEDAKASGSVRRALDNAGLKTSTVAPAERR